MTAVSVLRPLDADGYQCHALHAGDRAWGEANCYVDLWIEVLHAQGLDPHAMLGCIAAMAWDADQFTFYKPPLHDLERLYGHQVEELAAWDVLSGQVETQLRRGRLVILEADPWYLPDTHGVNYQVAHGKTAACLQAIDRDARRLGYFHNAGYFAAQGDDYDGVLREHPAPGSMGPYCELVRLGAVKRLADGDLRALSRRILGEHLGRRGESAVGAWRREFPAQIEWLRTQPLDAFHRWAFVTMRMLGSAAQLFARYVAWLGEGGEPGLDAQVAALERVRDGAKTLQFKVARAMNGKKPLDADPMLAELERDWDGALAALAARYP